MLSLRSIIFALALLPALALGQGYIPLQPAHSGYWYDRQASGEGIHLEVFDASHGPVVWAQVYGIEGARDFWSTAIEVTHKAWRGGCPGCSREYILDLFQRPSGVNTSPEREGILRLRVVSTGIWVHWHVIRDDLVSHRSEGRFFSQLTRPTSGYIGRCGEIFSYPSPPPLVDDGLRWCHH